MTLIHKKRLIRCALTTLLFVSAAAAISAIVKIKGGFIPCPFHLITGLNCPGCGNTRSLAALARFHFAESLSYNYAYPAEFIYIFAVYLRGTKSYVLNGRVSLTPKHPAAEYVFLAFIIIWGIARNILGV